MADRSVSVPMTLSDVKRRNTSVKGRGLFCGQPCPHLKRAGTERSQFIGMALLFTRTPFVWNSLHLRIRETQSLPGFKRHILRLTFSSQLTPPPSDPPSNAPRFFNRLRRCISSVLNYFVLTYLLNNKNNDDKAFIIKVLIASCYTV